MTGAVVIVSPNGEARLQEEAVRIAEIKARSAVPRACGPAIPVAPGRGPMIRFAPREMGRSESGGYILAKTGFEGRDAARIADVFDRMERAARKAHKAANTRRDKAGKESQPYAALFTPGQISAARDYAALVERVEASGVKCSSLETVQAGSGSGGDREEAILADFQRLRALQRRIGNGLAKEVRHIRPSQNGGKKRAAIYVRRLVDLVCLGDTPLSDVLERHGWSKDGDAVHGLRKALCAALDRMQGYDLENANR